MTTWPRECPDTRRGETRGEQRDPEQEVGVRSEVGAERRVRLGEVGADVHEAAPVERRGGDDQHGHVDQPGDAHRHDHVDQLEAEDALLLLSVTPTIRCCVRAEWR
jgi:hypothetical protein